MTAPYGSSEQWATRTIDWEHMLTLGLAALRRTRGWSQGDLAERCGLHRRTIWRLERQDRDGVSPSKQTLAALARAFGYVHLSDLWTVLHEAGANDAAAPLVVGERVRKMVLAFLQCSPRQQQLFEGMITACAALRQRDTSAEDHQLLQWMMVELQAQGDERRTHTR